MARVACVSLDPVNSEPMLHPYVTAVAMPVFRRRGLMLSLIGCIGKSVSENIGLSDFTSLCIYRSRRSMIRPRSLLGTKCRGLLGNVWFPDPAEIEFVSFGKEVECDFCRGSEYEVLCVTNWRSCDAIIAVDNKLV